MTNTANNESLPKAKEGVTHEISSDNQNLNPEINTQPEDVGTEPSENTKAIEQSPIKETGLETSKSSVNEAKQELTQSTERLILKSDNFVQWCESKNVPDILTDKNLTAEEKQNRLIEIITEAELENQELADPTKTNQEKNEELKNQNKEYTKKISKDIRDIFSYLGSELGQWGMEVTDNLLKHDIVRIIDMILGNYYNKSSGLSHERMNSSEAASDSIGAEEFFSYLNSNPREAAKRLYRGYGDLAKLGWQLDSRGEKLLETAGKASDDRALEILQLILTGVSQNQKSESFGGDSLISFLSRGSEDQQRYNWTEVGKIIGLQLFDRNQGLSLEIKSVLKNIKNKQTNPSHYFGQ